MKALVLGATGAVGKDLVEQLHGRSLNHFVPAVLRVLPGLYSDLAENTFLAFDKSELIGHSERSAESIISA